MAAFGAFVISVLLQPPAARLADRLGAVARPRVDRWHVGVVPRLGGLAIAGGVGAGILILPLQPTDRWPLLAGLAAMAALGLADDVAFVSPARRVLFEAAAAAIFTAVVTRELNQPIRVAAIVAATAAVPVAINATNLVDNSDGLASLLTVVTGLALAGLATAAGIATSGASVALVIAAASLAFLAFNLPPARVFMGDTGSLMLGFGLAACSILIVRDAVLQPGQAHVAVAMLVPLAWSFQIGDLVMVFATRWKRGQSPFQGAVDHTSHRLMRAGLRPMAMLAVISLGAAAIGTAAVAAAAWAGDFVVVAGVAIAGSVLVGAFEAAVAWRLPTSSPLPEGDDRRGPVSAASATPTAALPGSSRSS